MMKQEEGHQGGLGRAFPDPNVVPAEVQVSVYVSPQRRASSSARALEILPYHSPALLLPLPPERWEILPGRALLPVFSDGSSQALEL